MGRARAAPCGSRSSGLSSAARRPSMAAAILGRFDDRKMAWREPPTEAVDTSEPDVVSLATLLADPPEPGRDGGRARARVRGHDGIYSRAEGVRQDDDPRGGGRARESRTTVGGTRRPRPGPCWSSVTMTRGRGRWPCATLGRTPDAHPHGSGARGVQTWQARGAPGQASAHVGHSRQPADLVSVNASRHGQFKRSAAVRD